MYTLRHYLMLVPVIFLLSACTGSLSDSSSIDVQMAQPMPSYHFSDSRHATGKNVFIYDPNHLMWAAYNGNGHLVREGRGSGGRNYCPDIGRGCKTPAGTFSVSRKGDSSCVSKKFPLGKGGAKMPHCMFFYGGYAIHGSYDVPNYNASHGCIRVTPGDAAWLSGNFIGYGTTVIVRSY